MKPILHLLALAAAFTVISPRSPAAENAPPVTCILGALNAEVALLGESLTESKAESVLGIPCAVGKLKGRNVVLCRCGVGKVNAAMVTALLIQRYHPQEVIFSGIAGGINPDLHPGDIVIATKTVHHDLGKLTTEGMEVRAERNPATWERNPLYFEADPALLGLADVSSKRLQLGKINTSEGERLPRIIRGIVATGDVFVASAAKTADLRKTLKADAVEMEGASVAQVCHQLQVPWLVIRSISDRADSNAAVDMETFFALAAQHAAQLVIDIVEQLAAKK